MVNLIIYQHFNTSFACGLENMQKLQQLVINIKWKGNDVIEVQTLNIGCNAMIPC